MGMALTNADRQRRHRERLKAKLAEVAAPAAPDLLQRLVKAYRDAGVGVLAKVAECSAFKPATAAFLAEQVTEETILEAVAHVGRMRAATLYAEHAEAQVVEIRKRPRGKFS
jgi:hypothetical protein